MNMPVYLTGYGAVGISWFRCACAYRYERVQTEAVAGYMKNMVYERKVNRREAVSRHIVNGARMHE